MHDTSISIRLPEEANLLLDSLAGELHTTKTQLIRDAIMTRLEDYIDCKKIDDAMKKSTKTYTMAEMKERYALDS